MAIKIISTTLIDEAELDVLNNSLITGVVIWTNLTSSISLEEWESVVIMIQWSINIIDVALVEQDSK